MAKPRQRAGDASGRFNTRRVRRPAGVAGRPAHHDTVTTERRQADPLAPKLLARPLEVEQPHHLWAGDLPSVWTAEGWWSVAVRLALDSRQVVGWAMSRHRSADLVQNALGMALGRRRPAVGLRPHVDRGLPEAWHAYQRLLTRHGRRCRMSRTGEGVDQAVVERFFGRLKRERTAHRQDATRPDAREEVIASMELCYDSTRTPSYLGYVRPNDYERSAKVA